MIDKLTTELNGNHKQMSALHKACSAKDQIIKVWPVSHLFFLTFYHLFIAYVFRTFARRTSIYRARIQTKTPAPRPKTTLARRKAVKGDGKSTRKENRKSRRRGIWETGSVHLLPTCLLTIETKTIPYSRISAWLYRTATGSKTRNCWDLTREFWKTRSIAWKKSWEVGEVRIFSNWVDSSVKTSNTVKNPLSEFLIFFIEIHLQMIILALLTFPKR